MYVKAGRVACIIIRVIMEEEASWTMTSTRLDWQPAQVLSWFANCLRLFCNDYDALSLSLPFTFTFYIYWEDWWGNNNRFSGHRWLLWWCSRGIFNNDDMLQLGFLSSVIRNPAGPLHSPLSYLKWAWGWQPAAVSCWHSTISSIYYQCTVPGCCIHPPAVNSW